MKKAVLLFALALSFAACSKDDDKNNCESCTLQGEKIEICDNGDGTYTLNAGGESETFTEEDLDGLTPKQFTDALCALGALN
ncbi:hypothetical protein [Costertonia aggregata]|uniref:Membrane or secreted protein n=1 Tax=Costertonia aggregata TaxID=343403 RepID=A0A7H9APP5_9FLAO|nr:hypothetical protein [Costertonia aggregata]QLG45384.1 hypothetical protein HYG79_08500 [Costertonia aggregata]